MKHIENYDAWAIVITSLMAAGVDRSLAVGIVDILIENAHQKVDELPINFIISKCKIVNAPNKDAKIMANIDHIMPRLFSLTKQLLMAPNLKRKHNTYQYCRHAVLIEADQRSDDLKNISK